MHNRGPEKYHEVKLWGVHEGPIWATDYEEISNDDIHADSKVLRSFIANLNNTINILPTGARVMILQCSYQSSDYPIRLPRLFW